MLLLLNDLICGGERVFGGSCSILPFLIFFSAPQFPHFSLYKIALYCTFDFTGKTLSAAAIALQSVFASEKKSNLLLFLSV